MFAVILILVLLVAAIGNVIITLAASAGTGAAIVAWVTVGILSAPLSSLGAAVVYFELRSRSSAQETSIAEWNATSAAELLRPGLLEGVSIVLAGPAGDTFGGRIGAHGVSAASGTGRRRRSALGEPVRVPAPGR